MSLLLTVHIHQERIDVIRRTRGGLGRNRLSAARLEPLPDQLAVQAVRLDHQYLLHGGLRRW